MYPLKTGDPCPCCGMPIKMTDPDALRLLTDYCTLLGLVDIRSADEIERREDERIFGG